MLLTVNLYWRMFSKETVSANEVQYRSTYFYAVDRKIDSCIERQKLHTLGTKTYQKNLHTDIKRSKCKHNLEGKKQSLDKNFPKPFLLVYVHIYRAGFNLCEALG